MNIVLIKSIGVLVVKLRKLTLALVIILFSNIFSTGQQIVMLPPDKQEDIERYLELVTRYKQANNLDQAAFYLNKIALTYWEHNSLREAVTYFTESIPLNEKLGNYSDIKVIYSNIGLIYTDLERFDLALESFYKSLEIRRIVNDKEEIAAGLIDVAYIHGALSQHDKAIPLLEEALELSRELGNHTLTFTCLSLLAYNYDGIGNLAKASATNEQLTQIRELLARQEMQVEYEGIVGKTEAEVQREREVRLAQAELMELQQLRARFSRDSLDIIVQAKQDSLDKAEQVRLQKEQEIELLNLTAEKDKLERKSLEAEKRTTQIILYAVGAGLALAMLLLIFVVKSARDRKKANQKLSQQNEQIQQQSTQIKKQNENISKSINYAQGIQKALLPLQANVAEHFADAFIFFRPRDVVSGDYYWFKPIPGENGEFNKKTDKIAFSAIDCTGHGVPGAFLSMIGYNLLDEIIEKGIHTPGEILKELNRGVRRALRQDETDNRDGMDMALCVWDPTTRTLEFSGAKNPLVYISNGKLERIKGNKESIGGGVHPDQEYETHTININSNTWIYMFSDGYVDQFGGKDGRKFMIRNFLELLHYVHELSAAEQREVLKMTFDQWKGDNFSQIDDVLVMGCKFDA